PADHEGHGMASPSAKQPPGHAGHMGPGTAGQPATPAPLVGQPSAVLQPDALDAPTPTSLEDAARAEATAQEMAGGGHHMSHGSYSLRDAGRGPAPTPSPIAPGAPPAELESPHHMHQPSGKPSPSPSPSPRPSPPPKENEQ